MEDNLQTPVQSISSVWPEEGFSTFKFDDAKITIYRINNTDYNSQKQLNFKLKIDKYPNDDFYLKITSVIVNKDSDKNIEKTNRVKIAEKQILAYYSIEFPVDEIDEEHGWLIDGKFNIDTSFCLDNSQESSSSDNESDSDDDSFETAWLIENYSHKPGIYKSEIYEISSNKIHFEAIRNKSSMTSTTPFSVDIIADQIIGQYALKITVTIMNQDQKKICKAEKIAEISQIENRVVVTFSDLMQSEITEQNGFIRNNTLNVIIRLSEKDDNDDKPNRIKLSSTINNYSNNNYSYNNYSYNNNFHYTYHDSSKENTGYVGLQNQGATCYMNSMLQSLYHTPAFRKLIYEIPTVVDENESSNVILNLQRLFGLMQFSNKSCSTKSLTKSFGWDSHRTFIQHDTQEFLRVLIDNIEEKIKNNDELKDGISKILRGQMRNYIRCKDVDYESSRTEYFYDLSMLVKGCPTLEDSFKKYVETEELSGNDKYDTGNPTYGKQDALMGIEFLSFPPVLHLQLRRFEYDFDYDRNVKINDRFEFPKEIDLEPYLAKDGDRTKSNIYDLYGVLVHSGTVSYGHYYAFLRTSNDPQWFEFNDTTVSKVDEAKAIDDNFGGQQVRSFSAYFLVYVRRDDVQNIFETIPEQIIPQHIRDFIEDPSKVVKTISAAPKTEDKPETANEKKIEITNNKKVEKSEAQNVDDADVNGVKVKDLPHLQIETEAEPASISEVASIILFDYDDPNVPVAVIKANSDTNLTDLIQFISKSRNLNYDPEKDTLLLYSKEYFTDNPSSTPISLKTHAKLLTVIKSYKADSLYFIYYRYVPGILQSEMENKILLSIKLSIDGSTIVRKTNVVIPKNAKGYEALDAAFEKIDLNELKIDKNSILSDDQSIKYKNVHLMPIKNSKIVKFASLKTMLGTFYSEYRIDIIPEDLLNLNDDEIVILFSTAAVKEHNKPMVYGIPFFMKLKKTDTIEQLKSILKDKIEIDEKEFPKMKLFQGGEYSTITPRYELKNDKTLGELDLKAGIFIVKNMHRIGNTSSRKKEEALKIDN